MRQAIIIKNPKWEPFTAASDAFKKLDKETAVLVVRGRCKEKRQQSGASKVIKSKPETAEALAADLRKTGAKPEEIKKAVAAFKPIGKAAAVAALLLAFALPVFAQQNILPLLPATTIAATSTNSTAGSGFIGINIDQKAVFQLTILSTNTAASAVTVLLDSSDNGTDWLATQYTVATTANGTNRATSIGLVTNTVGGKYIRVGGVRNPNANAITIERFTVSLK